MARSIFWLAILLIGLPVAARGQSAREVDLRPKFTVGQQTRFKMELTNSSEPVAAPGSKPKQPWSKPPAGKSPSTTQPTKSAASPDRSSSKTEFTISLKVASLSPEHEATVNLVFDAVKISTTTSEGTIEFDSSKPAGKDDDLVAGLLRPLVGSTLTLKVDQAGNITSITGGESFSALGQFAGGGGQAGDLFGPIFSGRKGTGLARVGESWENADKIDNAMLGRFKMTTRHTLRSAAGTEARIDMTGKIEPDSEAPGEGAGKIKDSSFNGSYAWDTERGMLKRMDSTMRVRMETPSEGGRSETNNESVVKVTQVR